LASTVVVHRGIVLTISGVSKCVSLSANGVIGLLPSMLGVGMAIAFDSPIHVEACGAGSVAAVEDVVVRVEGRGLFYSSEGLRRILSRIIVDVFSHDRLRRQSLFGLDSSELAASSIMGSSIIVGDHRVPLRMLNGLWAVVVRLYKRLPQDFVHKMLVMLLDNIPGMFLDDTDSVFDSFLKVSRQLVMHGLLGESVREALRSGALFVVPDYSGRLLLAVVEDEDDAVMASLAFSGIGYRYEASIVV